MFKGFIIKHFMNRNISKKSLIRNINFNVNSQIKGHRLLGKFFFEAQKLKIEIDKIA